MICWIFSTGLPSLKQQENNHEFSNSSGPTSQYKNSQLFLTGLYVHSLSMLLVWGGSETFHHLGEGRQNFRCSFHRIYSMVPQPFPALLIPH